MSDFAESMATAQEASQKRNPFGVILNSWNKAQSRRYEEDAARKKEEAELKNALISLGAKAEYDKAMEEEKGKGERKTGLLESLRKGEITETTETEQGTFEGTPFGVVGKRFKATPSVEQKTKSVELKIKQKQLQQLESEGQVTANDKDTLTKLGIPEEEKDDYIIKTTTQTIRGIKTQIPILERKKTLPAKGTSDLADMESTRQDLDKNMQYLVNKGLQLGPGFSTRPGAVSDILGQMKGSDFATLKASIGRSFQKYRKWATGVAAGYPELNMLAPNYPKATDTNETFIGKTLDVMKDIERNRENTLNYFSDAGYAVGKLKSRMGQNSQQAQGNIPSFRSEQEAEASGAKGEVIINGRKARID